MINFVLYATATLIWGSTWLGIKLQLSQVPPILSVGYRFCLASLILLVFCLVTNKRLVFSRRDHLFLALQGISLFGLGYIMSYLATSYLTSGLVAVIFSTILMWNILNLRLFMGQPVAWRAFCGGMLGLAGICIVFWHDLSAFAATRGLIGLIIAMLGAYLASIGNVVGSRNAQSGVPVTQANVYGMAYGAALCIAIHFGVGGELTMDWSVGYLGPMLYLTVFGSVVAFGCYMLLIGRIGADHAAYVMLLMPVVALIISTFFESYQWSTSAVLGVVVVLLGNLIILTPADTLEKASHHILKK
ncbi:Permease of the drug/metabolite transporter (DMT) superfamily [Olavius algarvensis Delta 1 endosymbiont]|nr:Permease of the drug/metabolite transporter (DMT) superfamily [Olavius algarvensis Delta 1 endosymbiont]